jgi:hypothetical protein
MLSGKHIGASDETHAASRAVRFQTETLPGIEVLKRGRAQYADDPSALIVASHVVAVEFATIAAANNYWRR